MPPSPNQNSYFAAQQQRSRLPDVGQVWRWVERDESGLAVIRSQRGDIVRAWLAGNAAVADGQPVLYVPPGAGEVLGQVQLPTVLAVEDARVPVPVVDDGFRIAMILDANWCYTVPVSAESVELLKILTNGASRIITPPLDGRVVGGFYSPLGGGGANLADAAGIEVVGQPLDESAEGFIWLPLLNFNARFTSTELDAITRNALKFGALLIGEWSAWAPYNRHLIELFQPDFAQTGTEFDLLFEDLKVSDDLTVTMSDIGYWGVDIPEERIIGTLINRPGEAPSPVTGKPGAIWLDEED